jgi:fibronectin-binding autotransporter adhesin
LIKVGAGTLALGSANTYTGNTQITGGTLMVNNTSGSGTGSGTVTVTNAGSVLAGTGIVSGTVTMNSGSAIAPGNGGVGTLRLNNNTSFTAAAQYRVEIGASGTGDRLDFTNGAGTLNFNTNSELALSSISGFNPALNSTYTLASMPAGTGNSRILLDGITGQTNFGSYTFGTGASGPVILQPAFVMANGSTLNLVRVGDDLVLTSVVVPEQNAVLGLGAVGLGAFHWLRRRRSTRVN